MHDFAFWAAFVLCILASGLWLWREIMTYLLSGSE